jgi:predicted CoA-substrate-specific enzyme activase
VGINVAVDIGAVSLKLAALGGEGDAPLATALPTPGFFSANFPASSSLASRWLLLSAYRRIQGNPVRATLDLLTDFFNIVPLHRVEGIRVTGSGGHLIAELLGARFENEFRAVAKGVRAVHPNVRTIFEMGGESSKYVRLDPAHHDGHVGITDYQTSGDCAAGTGSFLDQQASRLLYAVEDVGSAACSAGCAARVAGRCSVFAKTDMIHAQQKGYTTDQILRGLCDAVARNFKSSIVKGRPVAPPVAFLGGVALNQGVAQALREVFKLSESDFLVPELYGWMGAIGSALFEAEETRKQPVHDLGALRDHLDTAPSFDSSPPLSMEKVVLLRNQARPAALPHTGRTEAYLGIDIGSVSTNLVVLDSAGNLFKEIYLPTSGRPIDVVHAGLQEIQSEMGERLEICGVGTTGSGRELIGELVGADTVNDEITAHKTGAAHVCKRLDIEPVDTIFEIGGQDSKFIRLNRGVVVDFAMNEACAAGTGSFLEEQAEKLGVSIKGQFAHLALASNGPARLGERCTVFMERDVTGLLLKGAQVGDLCAGLAYSVALNYLNRVVRGRKIGNVIFFQGGTAYNDAVAAAFSQILGKPIIVPPHNGVIGAIGMALIARERMQYSAKPSQFRGYDLNHVNYQSRDFVCRACSNYCDMKEFTIEGQKSYWGDKCSDMFHKRPRAERKPVVADLMEYHDKALECVQRPTNGGLKVGLPRSLSFYDRFPFWCTYLQELGCDVVVSAATDGRMATAGEELAIAQPCFPVQVAHGHVQALLNAEVDYVLLPNTVNAEVVDERVQSHYCPWNQTLPFVLRSVPAFEASREKLLAPTIHFRSGAKKVEEELVELTSRLGGDRKANRRAVAAAFDAQSRFRRSLLSAGSRALINIETSGEPAIVLLGRPYNIYDRNVNCDIPRKLRSLYGVNVIPLNFLSLDKEDISAVHDNMFWHSGRQILAAAQVTRRIANLHWIFLSNFKCGPDSYIKSFLEEASRKPGLLLQFDGHSNDAGYLTRCEAYLDSKGFLRCASLPISA